MRTRRPSPDSTDTKRVGWVVCPLLLAACFVMLFQSGVDRPLVFDNSRIEIVPPIAPSQSNRMRRINAALERQAPQSGQSSLTVLVLDEVTKFGIGGAELLAIDDASLRWYDKERYGSIGVAKDDGRAAISVEQLVWHDRTATLLIHASGFLPKAVAIERSAGSDEQVVMLERGFEQSVRCQDENDEPVAGARVVFSQWGGLSGGIPTNAMPGVSRRDACYLATSDESGKATFRGLPRGEYVVRIVHDELCWIVPTRQWVTEWRSITVPGVERSALLRRPWGYSISAGGDRLVYSNLRFPRQIGVRGVVGWNSDFGLTEMRRRLSESNPSGATGLVVLDVDPSCVKAPEITIDACWENAGWAVHQITLKPWTDCMHNSEEAHPRSLSAPCTRVSIALRDVDGELVGGEGFQVPLVRTRGVNDLPVKLSVGNGMTKALPPGEYRIDRKEEPFLAMAFDGLSIHAETQAAATPIDSVAPWNFEIVRVVVDSDIGAVGYAAVTIGCACGEASVPLRGERLVSIPRGRVELYCDAGPPFLPLQASCDVDNENHTLRLRLPAGQR